MKEKNKKESEDHADKVPAGPDVGQEQKGPDGLISPEKSGTVPPADVSREGVAGDSSGNSVKTVAEEKYLRLFADFDNFRKRTIRERSDLYQRANEEIIADLLPVLDHLDMALASATEHKAEGAVVDGFKLVADQMLAAMKKTGLSPIEAEGCHFNPMFHEAISYLSSDTVPEDFIITQVRKGYLLGGRMIRAARVIVSSGKPLQISEPVTDTPPAVDQENVEAEA